jgi:hypothetical protein
MHFGNAYGSFPSGHTYSHCCRYDHYKLTYPRWRWLYIIAVALVVIGLIGMDYHFVVMSLPAVFWLRWLVILSPRLVLKRILDLGSGFGRDCHASESWHQ